MKFITLLFKVVLSIFFILFALAAGLNGSYLQMISLILLVTAFFYWPFFPNKKSLSSLSRVLFTTLVLILQITAFKPAERTSIYKSEEIRTKLHALYEARLSKWPADTERIYLDTEYGKVHVLAQGDTLLPPVLLLHATGMSAHSWAENLDPLLDKYRIYAVDHIGEGNFSQLDSIQRFPISSDELADLYASIADQLGIDRSPVIAASNGGYIALTYAKKYPKRVKSLVLLAPMGLTELTGNSIWMMSVGSLYPTPLVQRRVTHWAIGKDSYVLNEYGEWFGLVMEGTVPSILRPEPLTREEKETMEIPILLFLGEDDPLVGNVEDAISRAKSFPQVEIERLPSGHLIGVEQRTEVNRKISEFLEQ